MDMELVLKRKIIKMGKTWAPVLLLMGLLIAVDSLDSVQGESLLSKMKFSLGIATQRYHLQLPAHTNFASDKERNANNVITSEFWNARHLLGRPTALGADPTPVTPQFEPVPPPPPRVRLVTVGLS